MNNVIMLNNDWQRHEDFDSASLEESGWFDIKAAREEGYYDILDIQAGETIIFVSIHGTKFGHEYTVKEDVRIKLNEPILYKFEGGSTEGTTLNDWYVWLKEDGFCLDEKLSGTKPETNNTLLLNLIEAVEDTIKELNQPDKHTVNSAGGVKFDTQKTQPGLLYKDLVNACAAVIRVLDLGAKKYSRANYLKVEDVRYEEAMLRHLQAYFQGEAVDPESGESHLAHVVCCVMFMLEKKSRGINL